MDSNHRPHAYQACALTTWAMRPFGGDEEDRTPDPLLAKQVLSQLSYTPILGIKLNQSMVGTNGLEPSTSRLSGVRSNHLSYAPI